MVARSHIVDCYSFEGSVVVSAGRIDCPHSQIAMAVVVKEVGCLALMGLEVSAAV
jgi:hypothetical protein